MDKFILSIVNNPLVRLVGFAVMLDTVLGFLRAIKERKFNSSAGIDGGIRKVAMLTCVLTLGLVDTFIHINMLFMVPDKYLEMLGISKLGMCEFFALLFSVYEATSILKNMVLCGLPIPGRAKVAITKFLNLMTEEMPKDSDNESEDK